MEGWECNNEHLWKPTAPWKLWKDFQSEPEQFSDSFIYKTFTSSSPQTASPLSPLHFLLFCSYSLSWLPLHVFFCFDSSPPPLLHSSSSSSSPPAGLCEQSLFSFLFSSFSSSRNPLLIYVHINYFSFVISTVGHDTILWARVHPPTPLCSFKWEDSFKRIINPLHDKFKCFKFQSIVFSF